MAHRNATGVCFSDRSRVSAIMGHSSRVMYSLFQFSLPFPSFPQFLSGRFMFALFSTTSIQQLFNAVEPLVYLPSLIVSLFPPSFLFPPCFPSSSSFFNHALPLPSKSHLYKNSRTLAAFRLSLCCILQWSSSPPLTLRFSIRSILDFLMRQNGLFAKYVQIDMTA